MVVLWILGILLALILVILLLRVGVRIRFGQELRIVACAGPVKLQLLPKVPKNNKKPKKEKKPKEKEKTEEKPKEKKKLGLTFDDICEAVPALFESLKRGLRKTRKRMKIDPMELSVTFGGDDPVCVSRMYGWSSAAMWTFMPQLEELLRLPNPHIHLDVDFNADRTHAEGEIGISFQIRDFFAIAFSFALPVLKWFLSFKKAKKARDKIAAAEAVADMTVETNEKKSDTIAE